MSIFGMHNLQTTVRLTVILPDNYGKIQRLHDDGVHFTLDEETITDVDELANFIEQLKANGGRMIDNHPFIDDDDLQEKTCVRYEYKT